MPVPAELACALGDVEHDRSAGSIELVLEVRAARWQVLDQLIQAAAHLVGAAYKLVRIVNLRRRAG